MLSGATVVPYLAVSFSVYDQLKAQVKEDRNTRQLWWYPLAKLGMGATASTVAQVWSAIHRAVCVTCHEMFADADVQGTGLRKCLRAFTRQPVGTL